jgi:hypothetical protein
LQNEPTIWFHDIFRLDGTAYDDEEVFFLKLNKHFFLKIKNKNKVL